MSAGLLVEAGLDTPLCGYSTSMQPLIE